jgi:inhibitor of cysteine peptidase
VNFSRVACVKARREIREGASGVKSKVARVACAVGFGLVLLAVGTIVVGCSESNAALTDADNGGSFTLKQGREFELALEANPSTGFGWKAVEDAGGLLEQASGPAVEESESESGPSKSALGRVQSQVFTFKAVKSGTGTLRMEYKRSWEITAPAEKTFTLTVTVD